MGISSTLTSLSLLLLLHFSEFCTCKCSRWKNEGGWNETGEWKRSENLNLLLGSYLLCCCCCCRCGCCRCCVLLPFNNSPLHKQLQTKCVGFVTLTQTLASEPVWLNSSQWKHCFHLENPSVACFAILSSKMPCWDANHWATITPSPLKCRSVSGFEGKLAALANGFFFFLLSNDKKRLISTLQLRCKKI